MLETELATPPFPLALNFVWRAWVRLRRRKSGGFSGPNPIGWPDIDAFIRRTGIRLDPTDIELIERLDDLFIAASADEGAQSDHQQVLKDGLVMVSKGLRKKEGQDG